MFQTPQWDFDASSESLYSQFVESVSEHMGCGIGYTCQVFTLYVRLGLPICDIKSWKFSACFCYCYN